MPTFSTKSQERLATCNPKLVHIFSVVIVGYDCTIIQGARSKQEQIDNVAKGVSKTEDSKHVVGEVRELSDAVDAAPYPVVWPQESLTHGEYAHAVGRFYHFAGYVKAVAEQLGYKIRWGGDWDSDLDFSDQTFDDLDHFETVE